jgi:hypothetical protein
LLASLLVADLARPAEERDRPAFPPSNANSVEVLVRVVAHGAMVLGSEVGGARVTITEVATGTVLASGLQTGEAGDQNQIMRTPRMMEEPRYSSRPSGAYRVALRLSTPTLVEIAAEGPLAYPTSMRRAAKTVLLVPGHDLTNDGIVLHLYGYIVQLEDPPPGQPLIAKADVKLTASVKTLSGAPVRPHGDWDSRNVLIYGEVRVGSRLIERLQMFYSGSKGLFEAPFFVPTPAEAPDGVTLRVVAADKADANMGMSEARYPVLPEDRSLRKK